MPSNSPLLSELELEMERVAQNFFSSRSPLLVQLKAARDLHGGSDWPSPMRNLCVEMAKLDFFCQAAPMAV